MQGYKIQLHALIAQLEHQIPCEMQPRSGRCRTPRRARVDSLITLGIIQWLVDVGGEGDVAEINLPGNGEEHTLVKRALEGVPGLAGHSLTPGAALVRSHQLASQLPDILAALRSVGVQPGEVRLRAITLEDVFIQLTGRRLRQ